MPVRPPRDSPPAVFREWARLYKRLRWVLRMSAEVEGNVRPGAKLARLRLAAKERGFEVALTLEAYKELLTHAECHYCGAALPLSGHGVDRKDPSVGYIPANVVLACDACNRIKGDIFSYSQMVEIGNLLRVWRARGAWSDPQRKDRPRFGGRPSKGNLRSEILAWNLRWPSSDAASGTPFGSGDPGDGSGLVGECCRLYSVEPFEAEAANEGDDRRAPAMHAAGPGARREADWARSGIVSLRGEPLPLPGPAEHFEQGHPFVVLRGFAPPGRVDGESVVRELGTIASAVVGNPRRNH